MEQRVFSPKAFSVIPISLVDILLSMKIGPWMPLGRTQGPVLTLTCLDFRLLYRLETCRRYANTVHDSMRRTLDLTS